MSGNRFRFPSETVRSSLTHRVLLSSTGGLQKILSGIVLVNNHTTRHERNSESSKSEPVRLENGESRVSDTRFAVVETDIELGPKSETGSGNRSAAAELARRLDGQAGSDIVKQVRVVMNRADAGDIRINLPARQSR